MKSSAFAKLTAVVAGCALPLAFAAPAAAKLIDSGTVHEEVHFVVKNSCGVHGFTTQVDITFDLQWSFYSRGNHRLPHLKETRQVTFVFTNVDIGEWVTIERAERGNDTHVTDNGDGTLTVLVLHTIHAVMYNQDGKPIARDTGNERFRILIDGGGTPTDPSDDQFLDFLGDLRPPTGLNDDFCAATVKAIG